MPQDWNDGRILFYTEPPKRDSGGHAAATIVQDWSNDFSADEVRSGARTLHSTLHITLIAGASPS